MGSKSPWTRKRTVEVELELELEVQPKQVGGEAQTGLERELAAKRRLDLGKSKVVGVVVVVVVVVVGVELVVVSVVE